MSQVAPLELFWSNNASPDRYRSERHFFQKILLAAFIYLFIYLFNVDNITDHVITYTIRPLYSFTSIWNGWG